MNSWVALLLSVACLVAPAAHAQIAPVDVAAFIRKDKFVDIKLSPNGDYYAATVPLEDRTVLAIMSRAENKITATFGLAKNSHVSGFAWVNPERVIIAVAQKFGQLDEPQPTGELFAINADGSKMELLVGYRVDGNGPGTRIQPKKVESVAAFLVDDLPEDDEAVVIAVWPFSEEPFTRAERLNVYTGRRTPIARAPVRRANFTTDSKGIVRFALGSGSDNVRKLYYRAADGADWEMVADESVDGVMQVPLGFSNDDKIAYLQVEQKSGPDAIVAWDMATRQRTEIMRDPVSDPRWIITTMEGQGVHDRSPVGAGFAAGKPTRRFFNADSSDARLYAMLGSAFPDDVAVVTSATSDGKTALVQVGSDRNPGDFYLLQTASKKADYLLSRRDWLDPAKMAATTPFELKARDGTPLHGFITRTSGSAGKRQPMIVLPHGGPFGIMDEWGFNTEAQMLAQAGYAVLKVNFRGSGGHGRAFHHAGARQWGGTMQDDVTDATRWAVQSGIADPDRICIYGNSYGAYAALMGVAREPSLYKCAAGYVGVYDLPMMHGRGDTQEYAWGKTFLKEWVGEPADLAAVSPTNMADRIKVPVFLAAGGEDERAPIEHTELMERRLKAAGVPVEALYYKTEGHGFYVEAHEREYYTKLLAFFSRHLGGATAK